MLRQTILVLTILAAASATHPQRAAAPAPSAEAEAIVRKVDALYRSSSSYSQVEMEIVTPQWQRTLRMNVWTRGLKDTFIRILAPAKEEGVATLRIGSEMWNYLPHVDKVIKIPPSMMMSSWMGSDFTNDDLVKEFSLYDDYTFALAPPADAQPDMAYVALTPKAGLPIVWGKIVAAVRKADYIPVWEKYYDDRGQLMRVIDFKDVRQLGGRLIPSVMEVVPQNKEGHKTVLRYLQAEFDIKLADEIFSLRNLHSKG